MTSTTGVVAMMTAHHPHLPLLNQRMRANPTGSPRPTFASPNCTYQRMYVALNGRLYRTPRNTAKSTSNKSWNRRMMMIWQSLQRAPARLVWPLLDFWLNAMSHRRLRFSEDRDHACGGNWVAGIMQTMTLQDYYRYIYHHYYYYYYYYATTTSNYMSFVGNGRYLHPLASLVQCYVCHDWWWVWNVNDWISDPLTNMVASDEMWSLIIDWFTTIRTFFEMTFHCFFRLTFESQRSFLTIM